jgi:uncharacterized protein (TIGR00369 family)
MSIPVETRSYDWYPVVPGPAPLAAMTGVEFFHGLARGDIAPQPITSTIGWTVEAAECGMIRLRFEPQPWLLQAAGVVHGGVIATLLDSAMSGAVMSTLAQGQGCTTLQLSITPVRAVRGDGGVYRIEGRTASVGRRVGVANAVMTGSDGTLYAQGSASCLIW